MFKKKFILLGMAMSMLFSVGYAQNVPVSIGKQEKKTNDVVFVSNDKTINSGMLNQTVQKQMVEQPNVQALKTKAANKPTGQFTGNRQNVNSKDLIGIDIWDYDLTYDSYVFPICFYLPTSLTQTLYYPKDIGTNGGSINSLTYYPYAYEEVYADQHIKVWIGETDMADLEEEWVNISTLTLVYDDYISFPSMDDTNWTIPLENSYVYNGGTLVICVFRTLSYDMPFISTYATYGDIYCSRYNVSWDFNPIDIENPDVGDEVFYDTAAPNITMMFNMDGMGSLSGVVSDEDSVLEGAKIQIVGCGLHVYTDENGEYLFPYLVQDTYDIEVSYFGYITQIASITINADDNTIQNITLEHNTVHSVSGKITGNDMPGGIENAEITITGYADYFTTTDALGNYSIPGLWNGYTYNVEIWALGYIRHYTTITIDNANETYNCMLVENLYPVTNVVAEVVDDEAIITWEPPKTMQLYKYDNGTPNGGDGFNSAYFSAIAPYGACHWQHVELHKISWFITATNPYGQQSTSEVNIYLFKLDEDGTPSRKYELIASFMNIPSSSGQWSEYTFPQPVETPPNGFYMGIARGDGGAFLSLGYSNATNATYIHNSNWRNINYLGGSPWQNYEDNNIYRNYMVRAEGYSMGKAVTLGYDDGVDKSKEMLNYSVFRLTEGQEEDEWDLLAENYTETEYIDEEWSELDRGAYQYAIKVKYTGDVYTIPRLSNILPNNIFVDYTINLTTSNSTDVSGAVVKLINQDGKPDHVYTLIADETGIVEFSQIWWGVYNLEIVLMGYITYTALLDIWDSGSLTVVLNEAFFPARKPFAELTEDDEVLITWEEPIPYQEKKYILDGNYFGTGYGGGAYPDGGVSFGNKFIVGESGELTSVEIRGSWVEGPFSRALRVDIYDGERNFVTSSESFMMPTLDWITVPLDDIPYSGTFYAMVYWPNVPGNSQLIAGDGTCANAGKGLDWHIMQDGTWIPTQDVLPPWSYSVIFGIRANVNYFGETKTYDLSYEPEKSNRALLGYKVYRLMEGQAEDDWDPLADEVEELEYTDEDWTELDWGVYQWAVKAKYDNDYSMPKLTNKVPKDMLIPFTINISSSGGVGIAGASVTLTNINGNSEYVYNENSGTTGISFDNVWRGIYNLTIKFTGHYTYTAEIDITEPGSYSAILDEAPLPVNYPKAEEIDNEVVITWEMPGSEEKTYILDDGSAEFGTRINPNGDGSLGNKFVVNETGELTSIDVYSGPGPGNTDRKVRVDIYNEEQELVGVSDLFILPEDDWITVPVDYIPYSGTFYAMVYWPNSGGNSHYLGVDSTGPYVDEGLDYYYDNESGEWYSFHPLNPAPYNVPCVFMIRANATSFGKSVSYGTYSETVNSKKTVENVFDFAKITSENVFPAPTPKGRAILGYTVYRLLSGETDEEAWDLLADDVEELTYTDTEWGSLPEGIYRWAIKANYTGDKISPAKLTNELSTTTYTVSGKVIGNDAPNGLENVEINLTGYVNFTGLTDESGNYSIPGVFGGFTYDIEAKLDGYTTYTSTIEVNNHVTHNITLNEIPWPVINPQAEDKTSFAEITWEEPTGLLPTIFRYDSGISSGQLGFQDPAPRGVMGSCHRTDAILEKIQWYLTDNGGAQSVVNVYIFDLNAQGRPTNTILYSALNVPTTIEQWVEYEFPVPVLAPNGFYMALCRSVGNFLSLGTSTPNAEWPFPPQTHFYSGDYQTGNYTALDGSFNVNFMLRAEGYSLGKSTHFGYNKEISVASFVENKDKLPIFIPSEPVVTEEPVYYSRERSKAVSNYRVYRLLDGQQEDETLWTPLSMNIPGTLYNDSGWETVPEGIYTWAVKAEYPGVIISEPRFTNILLKDMEFSFTVNLSTNSGDPVTGAVVKLTNQDENPNHVYTVIATGPAVYFPKVWKGTYDISVKLLGFHPVTVSNFVINGQGLSHNIDLEEITQTVINAVAAINGDNAVITWQEPLPAINEWIKWCNNDEVIGTLGWAEDGGNNMTSAIRFLPSDLASMGVVSGHIITEIGIGFGTQIQQITTLEIRIWEGGNSITNAGQLVYTQPITNFSSFTESSMNIVELSTPFPIDASKELRIGYRLVNTAGYPIGADAGPVVVGKGDLFQCPEIQGGAWVQAHTILQNWSRNFSIKAFVTTGNDKTVLSLESTKGLENYSVYRLVEGTPEDDWFLLNDKVTGLTFTDTDWRILMPGYYQWAIKANYTVGQSTATLTNELLAQQRYKVTFNIFDKETTEVIENAVITFNGVQLVGYIAEYLLPNTYSYTVSHPDYNTVTRTVTVTNANVTEDVDLTKVGIRDVILSNLVLSPNPFKNEINISDPNVVKSVKITDVAGQKLKHIIFNGKSISTDDLASGIYFVEVESISGEKAVYKMVKK